jgi:hypothetical protein
MGSQHSRFLTRASVLAAGFFALGPYAAAQTRWTVDPKLSLAWWQITPHMGHLWATTCPQEPSWRPGEGRSYGWLGGAGAAPASRVYVTDTIHVPRYPRYEALPVCTEAVEGEISVGNEARWQDVRGLVKVRTDALFIGSTERDTYARGVLLQSSRYPDIRFSIDSLAITARSSDTLSGTALGVFTLRGVARPMVAVVRAWPEAGGLRVTAKFRIPALDLVPVYGFSRLALGLGVGMKIWEYVFAGVDVVLVREQASRN